MTNRCPICKEPKYSSRIICDKCAAQLDSECFDSFMDRCPVCHYPILSNGYKCIRCMDSRESVIHCVARYDGDLSYAVLDSFKFHSDAAMAPVVACYLERALDKLDPEQKAVLVPIPCSTASLRRNGWDQMLLVCECLNRPYYELLVSKGEEVQQKRLGRKDRASAARGKFIFNSRYDKDLDVLKDRKVIVVDDVCTTMSTINSAISTLKAIGFSDVQGASWLLDILETGGDLKSDMV